ncbi:dipeptidyl-peptidase [Aureococcus anophagefferens]|nr:dipeptidyl-peptidase [Aureococcus anophagefferens]
MMRMLPSVLLVACVAARRRPVAVPRLGTYPTSANCTLHRVSQNLDHFDFTTNATFEQRVFVHADHWAPGGPIFLYCGNEDDVTLYVNATGLMWEHAAAFGAMLALADLVNALRRIKATYGAENAKTVAFGGSYGGMLAAWLRMKYPAAVVGAVAASAPILAFDGDGFDGEAYWEVVTRSATAARRGASVAASVREAFSALFRADLPDLARIFRTCGPVADRSRLALLALFAFDTMAMGNYPYESTYLTHGEVALPAFPVRAACERLAGPLDGDEALLAALAAAAGVTAETLPQETYFPRDGVRDMFWPAPANDSRVDAHCEAKYGVAPAPLDRRLTAAAASPRRRTSSSNGARPWSAGGVADAAGGATETVRIDLGAHHLDLMFAHPDDPPCVVAARAAELAAVRSWLA